MKNLPIKIHKLGLIWLTLRWKKIVLANGYLNLDETIKNLELENIYHKDFLFKNLMDM